MKKTIIALSMVLLLCVSVYAEEKMGAKALFYSGEGPTLSTVKKADDKKVTRQQSTKKERYMGIAYWIDLVKPDGEHVMTTTNREFKSGEKIKLNLKSNRDGYLYIVNIGTTGTSRVLFPHSGHTDNFIEASKTYSVPFDTYMKFDDNPGEETLLILLSPKPMNELSPSSPIMKVDESSKFMVYAKSKGAKDLLLEDDTAISAKTTQYVVTPMTSIENGEAISLLVKLKHR